MLVPSFGVKRRRRSRQVQIQSCDVLECRKLLSVTNAAPELTEINTTDAFITALVTDDGTSGLILAKVDVGSNGTFDFEMFTTEGAVFAIDLGERIQANQTESVTIVLEETVYTSGTSGAENPTEDGATITGNTVSSSVTLDVAGITLDAIQIDEIVGEQEIVAGTIVTEGVEIRGMVRVDWRAAGESVWNMGDVCSANGTFGFAISGANGDFDFDFDFDFVAVHTPELSEVRGDTVTVGGISGEPVDALSDPGTGGGDPGVGVGNTGDSPDIGGGGTSWGLLGSDDDDKGLFGQALPGVRIRESDLAAPDHRCCF